MVLNSAPAITILSSYTGDVHGSSRHCKRLFNFANGSHWLRQAVGAAEWHYCREILRWPARAKSWRCWASTGTGCVVGRTGSESASCSLVSFVSSFTSIVVSDSPSQHLEQQYYRNSNYLHH